MLSVIVVAVFVAMVFVAVARYDRFRGIREGPPVSIEDVAANAKTGDLLLFRHRQVHAFHDVVSIFTHVGLVMEDGTPRILEIHGETDAVSLGNYKEGVNVYPVDVRVRMYDGAVFWAPMASEVGSAQLSRYLETNLGRYMNVPFYRAFQRHMGAACLWERGCPACKLGIGTESKREGMFCSEFVVRILSDAGLVAATGFDAGCVAPEGLLNLGLHAGVRRINTGR